MPRLILVVWVTMTGRDYCLRSHEMLASKEGLHEKQQELEMNGDAASVSEWSAISVADEMEMLKLKLQIAEAELAKERFRVENSSTDSPIVQRAPMGVEEDRRLRYTSMLKGVLVAMPSLEALVPGWFEDAEATLDSYEVPPEWRAGLILPHLSERARGFLTRLLAEERKNYS